MTEQFKQEGNARDASDSPNADPEGFRGVDRDVTERNQAEESLRDSEEKYRTFFQNSCDPMFILRNGLIADCNAAAAALLGYGDAEEIVGLSPADISPEYQSDGKRSSDQAREMMEAACEGGSHRFEWEHRGLNGEVFPVEVGLTAMPSEKGRVLMAVWRDISDRKRAEDALRENEARLRHLSDNLPGGMTYQLDMGVDGQERRFTYVSAGVEKMHEVTVQAVLQDAGVLYGQVIEADRRLIEEREARAQATMTPFVAEVHFRLPSGAVRQHLLTSTPRRAPNGHLIWDGIELDITERKRAEDALRESERKLSAIFDHHFQLTGLIDTEGRLLAANRTALRLADAEESEVIGHYFRDGPWWDASQRRNVRDAVERAAKGEFVRFETTHPTRDGEVRDIDFSLNPVRDDDGNVIYVVPEGRDITEIKRAEQEKVKLQKRLNQVQKMEAVGRLAGGVAHDFNNMLSVIIGNVEMALEEEDLPAPVREELLEARNAAERSSDMTRQLLAFAREQTVSPKVLDLNETLEGMLKMLRRLIGENVHLAWMPGHGVWSIKIDPSQIDRLIANLCINACDAIEGVGTVTIETGNDQFDEAFCDEHAGFVPGEYARLAVRDNGCGMDAETQERIFEPFFTTKAEGRGTGLGLATVYGIVKQNDGFIDVRSEPRQGTTFSIYLPRQTPETDRSLPEKPGETMPVGKETILLVEDEPALLRLTMVMLQSLGYQVLPAESPGEAMEKAWAHTKDIHLLVTDVVMPEMNGRELANELARTIPDLQCIFMSGYTSDVISDRGMLDEGMSFIQKPFSKADLASRVRASLAAR